ncbi:MAG: alpha-L-fucosidase [Chloroflexi bacterium]|nr:alpha-L-fucosidase [Chloroflexota bacterium]
MASGDRLRWWADARYGMFVHWGLYAIPARGEWVMYQEHILPAEYARLADQFNPSGYDPDAWVRLAREAGMRYMVLTSRHHDGYSLFDSEVSSFSATKRAAGRDLLRAYVEACHRGGMPVGFYYSLLDWRYPAYFRGPQRDPEGWVTLVDYVHSQARELCTNYGQLDILWYDGAWPYTAEDWRSDELNAMVRELQPGIVINNRAGTPEDYDTPEQHIAASEQGRPWEACMTLNGSWGYSRADKAWKSPASVIESLVRCASQGGNLLLNVGPQADGSIPEPSERILRQVGAWLRVNGASIYGTEACPFFTSGGLTTARGSTVFVHMLRWPGREMVIPRVLNQVRSAHMLAGGQPVAFQQRGDRVVLSKLPAKAPDALDTVIVLELDGRPRELDYFQAGFEPAEDASSEEERTIAGGNDAPV